MRRDHTAAVWSQDPHVKVKFTLWWGLAFTVTLTRRQANRLALDIYKESVAIQRRELGLTPDGRFPTTLEQEGRADD